MIAKAKAAIAEANQGTAALDVSIGLTRHPENLEKIFGVLQAISPAANVEKLTLEHRFEYLLAEAGIDWRVPRLWVVYGKHWRKLSRHVGTNEVEQLAQSVGSLLGLRSLSLHHLGLPADSAILQRLTRNGAACSIKELSFRDIEKFPSAELRDFLSSESSSALEKLTVSLLESTPQDVQNLVNGLLCNKSLTKLYLEGCGEIFYPAIGQILSKYFESETKLKYLNLRMGRFDEVGLDAFEAAQGLKALLTGLQSNAFIAELKLYFYSYDWGPIQEVTKTFFSHVRSPTLILELSGYGNAGQMLADGLRQNPWVRNLQVDADDFVGRDFEPLAKMLTVPEGEGNMPPVLLSLESLKLKFSRTSPDLSCLYDLVRRPVPTLKSIHIKMHTTGLDQEEELAYATACLQALAEGKGLGSFCLDLPFYENRVDPDDEELDLKPKLYRIALLNTSLTSVSLEPFCRRNPQFKRNLQSIHIRNKVHHGVTGFRDHSLPLQTLPAVLGVIQRECQEVGLNPERYNAELIHAGLHASAEPAVSKALKDSIGQVDVGAASADQVS